MLRSISETCLILTGAIAIGLVSVIPNPIVQAICMLVAAVSIIANTSIQFRSVMPPEPRKNDRTNDPKQKEKQGE